MAYSLDRMGSYLMSFSAQYFEEVAVVGRGFAKESIINSLAALTLSVVKSIVSASFGLMGAFFCKGAQIIKGEESGFIIKGKGVEVPCQGKVTLLSLNCDGIAGSRLFDATEERFSRLPNLHEKINLYIETNQPFIFCGQECFGYFAHALSDQFQERAAYSCLRGRGKIFGMDNGLALFTNMKVQSVTYRSFTKFSGFSRESLDHGYQIADFGKFVMINTHFDKGRDKAINENLYIKGVYAIYAMKEIKKTVQELGLGNMPIYLAGDLNNEWKAKEFWENPIPTCTNQMEVKAGIALEREETTLDVLSRLDGKSQPTVISMVPLSDHSLLRLEIEIASPQPVAKL